MAKLNVKVLIDLSAGLTWNAASEQDITQWVSQISVRRGRQRLLNEFEAGTATIVLFDNGSGLPAIPTDYIRTGKVKITAKPFSTEYPIYYGFINSSDTRFNQSTDEISQLTFNCTDSFRLLNNAVITTVTGASAQLSGARIGKILDQVSFPAAPRLIDAGMTTCQADPGTQRTSLDAIRTVEKTEGGGFFIDRSGAAKFLDRDSIYNKLYLASPLVTTRFVDFPLGISTYLDVQYQNAVVRADDDLVYNDITVTRVGGTAQNKQNASSIATYFKRSAARNDVLMQTNAEAADLASVLLQTLKDADTRIDSVTVDLSDVDSSKANRTLSKDLLDVVYAQKTMPDGSTLKSERTMIQGIQFNITPNKSSVTYYLAEPLLKGLILDDNVFGRLDYNYLGY